MPHPHVPTKPVLSGSVFPDFGAVGGSNELESIIGALLTVVLILAVLMLIVCAIMWAIGSANGTTRSPRKPASACGRRSVLPPLPGPGSHG